MGILSERLKEWYGMPKFQPSKVDEEILVIIDEIAQLEAENARLNLGVGICEWWYDGDSDIWMTSCSNAWVFTNDGPKENECQYCVYCGGVLEALERADLTTPKE